MGDIGSLLGLVLLKGPVERVLCSVLLEYTVTPTLGQISVTGTVLCTWESGKVPKGSRVFKPCDGDEGLGSPAGSLFVGTSA